MKLIDRRGLHGVAPKEAQQTRFMQSTAKPRQYVAVASGKV
jgi:hypothetical protein